MDVARMSVLDQWMECKVRTERHHVVFNKGRNNWNGGTNALLIDCGDHCRQQLGRSLLNGREPPPPDTHPSIRVFAPTLSRRVRLSACRNQTYSG